MTTYLLDASVLIPLLDAGHQDHAATDVWMARVKSFATCPITEGALVRYVVRMGHTWQEAATVVAQPSQVAGFEFWPDSIPYQEADLSKVEGHKNVTDAYLVSLVSRHKNSLLATYDKALAERYPNRVELLENTR